MEAELIVRGTAEVRVPPDHATITVRVDADGASQREAYEKATPLAAAVDSALAEHAASITRSSTAALVVRPREKWKRGESVRTGWRAARATTVEVAALDKLGDLIAALATSGAQLDGPTWDLAPGHQGHDAVRTAAAKDARRRAASYAEGLGLVVGDIAWMREPGVGEDHFPEARGGMLMARAAAGPDPIEVEPELITLHAAVDVAFRFRPRPTD